MTQEQTTEELQPGKDVYNAEQWINKRIFVRELAGKYGEVYRELYSQPRVYKSKDKPWKAGPVMFHKGIINPQHAMVTQTIETHLNALAPGGHGNRHGHMNGAVMYVLDGKGYEIHDRVRHDWEAGDAAVVENACVHQHFNGQKDRPTRYVIFKAKPLYLFFNLLFQKNVDYPPAEPIPGWENFMPED